MMMMRIKNWEKYQHFKNRRPPWIKLYRELLDDYDISLISDRSFRVLVNLWLMASEDKTGRGILPHIDAIVYRLRIEKESIIKALEECDNYLIQDDDSLISSGYQDGALETETETEKETEKESHCFMLSTTTTKTDTSTINSKNHAKEFNDWYAIYPKRVGRAAAEKSFIRVRKSGVSLDTLTDAIYNQIEAREKMKRKGEWMAKWKHPSTWLNQGCWDDEIDSAGKPMEIEVDFE
jgi:hypothetical protein